MPVNIDNLSLCFWPDPVLKRKAEPITEITSEVRDVVDRMIHIMHESRGVGLAAPQVGLSWRLFVANPTGEPDEDLAFINPTLLAPDDELVEAPEGCLSIPDAQVHVRRPKAISIEALDAEGQSIQLRSDTLAARVWQHEYDHLEGVLILDRMGPMDRMANRKILKELEASYEASRGEK